MIRRTGTNKKNGYKSRKGLLQTTPAGREHRFDASTLHTSIHTPRYGTTHLCEGNLNILVPGRKHRHGIPYLNNVAAFGHEGQIQVSDLGRKSIQAYGERGGEGYCILLMNGLFHIKRSATNHQVVLITIWMRVAYDHLAHRCGSGVKVLSIDRLTSWSINRLSHINCPHPLKIIQPWSQWHKIGWTYPGVIRTNTGTTAEGNSRRDLKMWANLETKKKKNPSEQQEKNNWRRENKGFRRERREK